MVLRTKRNQWQRANRSGQVAEEVVGAILDKHGIEYVRQQPIGLSIYRHPLRADYYLPTEELIIECKWQEVNGSADEKLPYLVENIRQCYPYPCLLVLGGTGWKAGAVEWVRLQVNGSNLIGVLSFEEFMRWCNKRF